MAFNSVFKPSKEQPIGAPYTTSLLANTIPPQAILALGGLVQCFLLHFFPLKYALIPTLGGGLFTVLDVTVRFFSNHYMQRVIPGRVSVILPDRATGKPDSVPASAGLVVLHIGARCNHPLGPLAPGFKEFSSYFQDMNDDLKARADELGLISVTSWRGDETLTVNTTMNIYYFRDMDCVSRFAHDVFHRKAWAWYNKGEYPHLGVFHEVYDVPAKSWESIYANMQPTLLGDGQIPCNDKETSETVWVNPLVDAKTPALRGMLRRMGRKDPPSGKDDKVW
ncbi:hypothetical protein LCI18_006115 [Fusarium solani-melongenae]|uniref:Uncharacterized protein n=1 Tax=Fusarium solani subsp. cucurbitae TaxID=2747967 RepID=A0ACD3Z1V6_FUSSC|nr:hypothetical protein LCI18_006115 [Fusarium solani-melongenae]